jgi:hypothetical protein
MTKELSDYYKLNGGTKKIFWLDNKEVGDALATVKFLMNKRGVSSAKAHKFISKLKELKNKDANN